MQFLTIIEDFFKNSDNYSFVLLFGSYCNNNATENSDIDIGVYFKGSVDYMTLGYESAKLESLIDKKIDMIVLNNIYKKDPLFGFNVLSNHKVIVVNDEKSFISFKRQAQLYYLDHKPLIEMNKKALLNRIESGNIGDRDFVREN
jgi:predicted nucleotidyltransferase